MLIGQNCYKCILNQCADLAIASASDTAGRNRMLGKYLQTVAEYLETSTPPEMAEALFRVFYEATGIADPYLEKKLLSTQLAQQLYPEFAAEVAAASDPFIAALRFTIGGNIIDYGVMPDFDLSTAAAKVREAADMPLDMSAAAELRQQTAAAKNIIYLLDNCGEAVFDRLLIDQIGSEKITLAVRGGAILNDVTRNELTASGLTGMPVIDSGSRTPGVSLKTSSPEFLRAIRSADLVIAKGQGNFESLYGEKDFGNVFFLFRVKCPVLVDFAGVRLNSLQVKKNSVLRAGCQQSAEK
ncbi:MAG: DUF89 family protein [Lentisphaeria bacterium]|nr:DUF89 family protein [Lentisphaeria bacterium]